MSTIFRKHTMDITKMYTRNTEYGWKTDLDLQHQGMAYITHATTYFLFKTPVVEATGIL